MQCYRCLQTVTARDNIVFVARNPVHRDRCPVYDWKWKRANRKSVLVLTKDGKKIGTVRLLEGDEQDEYGDWIKTSAVLAYAGGKPLGQFSNTVAGKIAVEKALGVSTKKSKKKPEPKVIR